MDIYDSAMILAAVLALAHFMSIALAAWRCRPAEGLAIAPGNAPGVTIQQQNPGVGLFPPNSNTQGGDTVLAALERAVPLSAPPS